MLRFSKFRMVKRSTLAATVIGGLTVLASAQAWAATITIYAPPDTGTAAAGSAGGGTIYAPPDTGTQSAPPAPSPSPSSIRPTPTSSPTRFTIYAPPDTSWTAPPSPKPTPTPSGSLTRLVTFAGPAGSAPRSADWNYELGGGGWGNNELETYTNSTANSYVDGNGHLVISARRETVTGSDGITRNYTSARLSTAGKVVAQPGSYVEASITAPVGTGVWPAFWTIGANVNQVGWPQSGEIDILEGTGATPTLAHTNIHVSRLSDPSQNNQVGWGAPGATVDLGVSLDSGPHLYGMYFDAHVVQFYIDRKPAMQFTAVQAAATDRAWPFDKPQYLILNVAVDGDPSATSFPRSMTVGPIGIYNKVPF